MSLRLLLTLALAAPEGLLSEPRAQELFDDAQVAFGEERYEESAQLLEKAFLIEPEPLLLYPWAQAERSRGRCDLAIPLYEQFLESEPDERLAAPARENIARCKEQVEAEEAVVEVDDDEDDEVDDAEVDDDEVDEDLDAMADEALGQADQEEQQSEEAGEDRPEPAAKPWYTDVVGGVLTGAGLVGVGVGAGFLGAGVADANAVGDEDSNEAYLELRDRAVLRRNVGAAVLSVGGALLLGGVIRYVVVAKREPKREPKREMAWLPWRGPGGATGMMWTGRF